MASEEQVAARNRRIYEHYKSWRPGGGKYRHNNAGGQVWLALARHWRMPVSEIKQIVWEQRGPLSPVEEMKRRRSKEASAEFHALMEYLVYNVRFVPPEWRAWPIRAIQSKGPHEPWL